MYLKLDEYNSNTFQEAIINKGFCVVTNVFDVDFIEKLKAQSQFAIEKEAEYHGSKDYKHYGIVQACPMYGGAFLDVLENRNFVEPFNEVMGEGCIVYVYITSSMPPFGKNFASRIHVDRPWLFEGYCECLAGLILLDDFTQDNGSTWLLPGSQNTCNQPEESDFYSNAVQIIAPAGSVLYFNLRTWHAGGINNTHQWRNSIAIGMVRPYLKQKFDLPGMLKSYNVDLTGISNYAKQKLGFFAIPPKTLDEFYGKNTSRTYLEKSEWEIADLIMKRKE